MPNNPQHRFLRSKLHLSTTQPPLLLLFLVPASDTGTSVMSGHCHLCPLLLFSLLPPQSQIQHDPLSKKKKNLPLAATALFIFQTLPPPPPIQKPYYCLPPHPPSSTHLLPSHQVCTCVSRVSLSAAACPK